MLFALLDCTLLQLIHLQWKKIFSRWTLMHWIHFYGAFSVAAWFVLELLLTWSPSHLWNPHNFLVHLLNVIHIGTIINSETLCTKYQFHQSRCSCWIWYSCLSITVVSCIRYNIGCILELDCLQHTTLYPPSQKIRLQSIILNSSSCLLIHSLQLNFCVQLFHSWRTISLLQSTLNDLRPILSTAPAGSIENCLKSPLWLLSLSHLYPYLSMIQVYSLLNFLHKLFSFNFSRLSSFFTNLIFNLSTIGSNYSGRMFKMCIIRLWSVI